MLPAAEVLYDAYLARDARFDGVFFVGVTSTGIYCRPVCTARTPKRANCRFFASAAAAEQASFRPCLRCRPELAPGRAPVDGPGRLAGRVVQRIAEGMLDDGAGLEAIAAEFHVSSRQIRRIVRQELGVSPIQLVLTRRLLLAKQLLTETSLPIIDVAFSSGFSSLRRFNDAFQRRYGMPPTHLRRAVAANPQPTHAADAVARGGSGGRVQSRRLVGKRARMSPSSTAGGSPGGEVIPVAIAAPGSLAPPSEAEPIVLKLAYRPPFDWSGLLSFLAPRALRGVEVIREDAYLRTVQLADQQGWIRVRNDAAGRVLRVEMAASLVMVLPGVLTRLRHLFDLTARPDVIATRLRSDPELAPDVEANPGLRVPGAFDGFELALRAILGQQVTVKGASTLAGRFVAAFGAPIATSHEDLAFLSPRPERIAEAGVEEVASLGLPRSRAAAIVALAAEVAAGQLRLEPAGDPEETLRRLVALPGIGPWTAQYIAMRALRWPDAFPAGDAVLRSRLGGVSTARMEARSQPWRPWRSYAAMHLWRRPATPIT